MGSHSEEVPVSSCLGFESVVSASSLLAKDPPPQGLLSVAAANVSDHSRPPPALRGCSGRGADHTWPTYLDRGPQQQSSLWHGRARVPRSPSAPRAAEPAAGEVGTQQLHSVWLRWGEGRHSLCLLAASRGGVGRGLERKVQEHRGASAEAQLCISTSTCAF